MDANLLIFGFAITVILISMIVSVFQDRVNLSIVRRVDEIIEEKLEEETDDYVDVR